MIMKAIPGIMDTMGAIPALVIMEVTLVKRTLKDMLAMVMEAIPGTMDIILAMLTLEDTVDMIITEVILGMLILEDMVDMIIKEVIPGTMGIQAIPTMEAMLGLVIMEESQVTL